MEIKPEEWLLEYNYNLMLTNIPYSIFLNAVENVEV